MRENRKSLVASKVSGQSAVREDGSRLLRSSGRSALPVESTRTDRTCLRTLLVLQTHVFFLDKRIFVTKSRQPIMIGGNSEVLCVITLISTGLR